MKKKQCKKNKKARGTQSRGRHSLPHGRGQAPHRCDRVELENKSKKDEQKGRSEQQIKYDETSCCRYGLLLHGSLLRTKEVPEPALASLPWNAVCTGKSAVYPKGGEHNKSRIFSLQGKSAPKASTMKSALSRMSVCSAALLLLTCSSFQTKAIRGCRLIQGIPGPEDFAIDEMNGSPRLLVSSQERRLRDAKGEMRYSGAIFAVDLKGAKSLVPYKLGFRNRDDYPFHPHGIYLQKRGSSSFLYVINHALTTQHSIEKYRVGRMELYFLERYRSELLVHPNDLVVSRQGDLYVTNDHLSSGFWAFVGDALRLGNSNVVHRNPQTGRWSLAASGINFANGVELDDKHLYVAALLEKSIHVYRRDPRSGRTGDLLREIEVGSGVDNLMWERPGVLITAAHPALFAFLDHVDSSENHSPSEIYRIELSRERVQRIYADDGTQIDAASTGQIFRGRLYISGVFDPEILVCPAP